MSCILTKELVLDIDEMFGSLNQGDISVLDRMLELNALRPLSAASQDLDLLGSSPSSLVPSAHKLTLGRQELHVRLLHTLLTFDKVPALDEMTGNITSRLASHTDRNVVPGHTTQQLSLDQVVVVLLD